MEKKYTEVELKFPLLNSKELVEKLNKIAKPTKQEIFQKDTYYVPAHRNFLDQKKVTEWLRIRETKNKITLNYKNWYGKVHCDEFETIIEDIFALKKIFESLDFKEIVTVEKTRSVWLYKNVEISIDDVKGLGSHIELEASVDLDVEQAKTLLYNILKDIGAQTGEQDFRGYPHRLLEKTGYKFSN